MFSTDRNFPILLDLWKWKLLTTGAICLMHAPKVQRKTLYNRLLALEKKRFIKSIPIAQGEHYWSLDKKGYAIVRDALPQLKNEGFQSEHMEHDAWTTAIHLGNWVRGVPQGYSLISEQELRNYHSDSLPSCLSKGESHRPDGYWLHENVEGKKTHLAALEFERSIKGFDVYQKYIDFYDLESDIDMVVWIVTADYIGKRIKHVLTQDSIIRPEIHFLGSAQDFESRGWNLQIQNVLGKEKTLFGILTENIKDNTGISLGSEDFQVHFKKQKSPVASSTSRKS